MSEEIFPEAPSYEELEEMREEPSDYDDLAEFAENNEEWYEKAVPVAARMIIEAAIEYESFKDHMLEDDSFGAAHKMKEWDKEKHEKFNSMGLSAAQGGTAENIAREYIRENL